MAVSWWLRASAEREPRSAARQGRLGGLPTRQGIAKGIALGSDVWPRRSHVRRGSGAKPLTRYKLKVCISAPFGFGTKKYLFAGFFSVGFLKE